MTPDLQFSKTPDSSVESLAPKIYTVGDIKILPDEDPNYIRTKDHTFRTRALLPVDLNGRKYYLGAVPIIVESKIVGYMFWYDPKKEDLAHDTAKDMIRIGKRVAPSASLGLTIESGKSRAMCREVALGMGIREDRIEEFAKCSVEEALEIMGNPERGVATLYKKITSGDQDNGMKLSLKQVQVIKETPDEEMVDIDDISSTGGTGKGMDNVVNSCKGKTGEKPRKITKIVGGLEVPNDMLVEGWKPPEDVHAVFTFPVISGAIVQTPNGEIDFSELVGITR